MEGPASPKRMLMGKVWASLHAQGVDNMRFEAVARLFCVHTAALLDTQSLKYLSSILPARIHTKGVSSIPSSLRHADSRIACLAAILVLYD